MRLFTRTAEVVIAVLFTVGSPLAHAASFKPLYSFKAGGDGAYPVATLVDVNGTLYGTTDSGGSDGWGTIFSIDLATTTENVVYTFTGRNDGAMPESYLLNVSGFLYGTTSTGGGGRGGTIFAFNIAGGTLATLFGFTYFGATGSDSVGGLIEAHGDLFGTTAEENGTLFKFNPVTGKEHTIYTPQGNQGGYILGGMLRHATLFYGTTYGGGDSNDGVVYKFDPQTKEYIVFHSFAGGADGAHPYADVIYLNGGFYGTTAEGGTSNLGTIFRLDATTGAETTLYSFAGGRDGANPTCTLIRHGRFLYGTTQHGGLRKSWGTIFKVDITTGVETVLHRFDNKDGAEPQAGLIYTGGAFYGTTEYGGLNYGTVFSLTP